MKAILNELKTLGRIIIKDLIPYKIFNSLRVLKQKKKRNAQRRKAARLWSLEELKAQLKDTPIDRSKDLFIHASFSTLSTTASAQDVIDALLEHVGEGTTLLMPAYPMPGTMLGWMLDSTPFDVQNTPSTMGILSEVLRKKPGAQRSKHPTHSVVAFGPKAMHYTRDHHLCPAPCAAGSPFVHLIDNGGQIVCIGTDVGKITAYHVPEDTDPSFPVQTYRPDTMQKTVIDKGQSFNVTTKVGNPHLSPWRIDNFRPKLQEFRAHLKDYNILKTGRLGGATVDVLDAASFNGMLQDLAKKGVTIYHRPRIYLVRLLCNFPY